MCRTFFLTENCRRIKMKESVKEEGVTVLMVVWECNLCSRSYYSQFPDTTKNSFSNFVKQTLGG